MHEAMVAQSLLTTILAEAEKQDALPISAKISCGTFNAVNYDILSFAFEAIAKGTVCEKVKLEIENKPIRAKCNNCNKDFDVDLSAASCPNCSNEQFELLPDAPLVLEQIEFQTE